MPGGLTCPRCAGLLVPDADDPAYAKCVACGRSWTPAQVGRSQPVQDNPGHPAPAQKRQEVATMGKWTPEARAAHQQRMKDIWAKKRTGGGTAQPGADAAPERCGVAGCKKPRRADSTQCERHYQKSLRNNIRYREKTKKALNGSGTDWKSQALSALVSQRETLTAKIQEIDTVMTAIQGM